jgi:hypothetical protein
MYATRLADRTSPPEVAASGLRRALRLTFPNPAVSASNPAHTQRLGVYMTDMLTPYGLGLTPGALERGAGQSYGEMAEAMIREIVPPGEEIDLLVLAIAIPDITPGRATAIYLSYKCPGNPMAYAICDQGTAAGFTGLRLIDSYASAGECPRALLIIVEQAELSYDPRTPVTVPAGHVAVGLLFGASATHGRAVSVRNHTDVGPSELPAVLAARVGELFAGHDDAVTIVGTPLATLAPGAVAEGQPLTGVWAAFARAVPGPSRVILADYDPQLRYLSVAAFDPV